MKGHIKEHPIISKLPAFITQHLKIKALEVCHVSDSQNRERYWIEYFTRLGAILINKKKLSCKPTSQDKFFNVFSEINSLSFNELYGYCNNVTKIL